MAGNATLTAKLDAAIAAMPPGVAKVLRQHEHALRGVARAETAFWRRWATPAPIGTEDPKKGQHDADEDR